MNKLRCAGALAAALCLYAVPAPAQLTAEDVAALRAEGAAKGWTFTVGESAATHRALESLCGFKVTEEWAAAFPPYEPPAGKAAKDLPSALDWRDLGGVPAVRDQGPCGSCWAFSMLGAVESAILINDGLEVDLSEQWLVSCNREGFGCSGFIFVFDYLVNHPGDYWKDLCGQSGAPLEADFPYLAYDAECTCPHPRRYWIHSYGSAGHSVEAMKQSILDYGPISVSLIANGAFQAYSGGVFNACAQGGVLDVNHAVVLVGWDDALGTEGVWILRNSWDDDWGMDGYMYIEYGCSQVGAFAARVDYGDDLGLSPHESLDATGEEGGPFAPESLNVTVSNDGPAPLDWEAAATVDWVTVSPDSGSLLPGQGTPVAITINEYAGSQPVGLHTGVVTFTNLATGKARPCAVTLDAQNPTAYSETMDADPGWTCEGAWAYGPPTGAGSHNPDPTSGYTADNVYGYNIEGDYANGMVETCLTTSPFDCSNLSGVTLEFRRWVGVERSNYDHARVQASTNGSTWTTLWENPNRSLAEQAWTRCEYDLSAVADHEPTVYVRWTMGPTDGSATYSGWNIDDVIVTGRRDGQSAFEFTEVPHATTLMAGDPLSLAVQVSGAVGEVHYQWIKDAVALPGETFDSYELDAVTTADDGWYCCRAWDESKGVHTTDPVRVRVYSEADMPTATAVGLGLAALAVAAGAWFRLRRRR